VSQTAAELLSAFETAAFSSAFSGLPERGQGYVYVFCYSGVPFYAGQTCRLKERMEDYAGCSFQACTDFRVGSAAKYLAKCGFEVTVRYRKADKPRIAEKALIRDLVLAGYRLLNSLPAFDYSASRVNEELAHVHRFCDMLIQNGVISRAAAGS
jgi:hypothetical protein